MQRRFQIGVTVALGVLCLVFYEFTIAARALGYQTHDVTFEPAYAADVSDVRCSGFRDEPMLEFLRRVVQVDESIDFDHEQRHGDVFSISCSVCSRQSRSVTWTRAREFDHLFVVVTTKNGERHEHVIDLPPIEAGNSRHVLRRP